jgi:hypothetical protein
MDMRPLRAYRRISEQLSELERAEILAAENARFELAQSTSRFCRRTQEVVDGTMSLSAALMRAGEVAEANRLLEEVERDVATEEAALIETVNEVKVRGELSRSRITRLKLMKMIAAATMGASMFVFSAFGVAVAGFLADRPAGPGSFQERGLSLSGGLDHSLERVTIAGVSVELTRSQAILYSKLTRGKVDDGRLSRFLLSVLPLDLAREVQAALDELQDSVVTTATGVLGEVSRAVDPTPISVVKEAVRETQAAKASSGSTDETEAEEGPQPNEGGGEVEKPDDDDDNGIEGIPLPVDNPLGG